MLDKHYLLTCDSKYSIASCSLLLCSNSTNNCCLFIQFLLKLSKQPGRLLKI